MYIDAWNQYKGSKKLDYKWVASGAILQYGSADVNGYVYAPAYGKTSITDFGTSSASNSLTTEANSMFITSYSYWWLASPSCYGATYVCYVSRFLQLWVFASQNWRHFWRLPASFSRVLSPRKMKIGYI
ncbi:MAG: hypothetical protein IJ809_07220 [Clostridia bacterium]|nr:hypothetical protein [Clostridia bacterium]